MVCCLFNTFQYPANICFRWSSTWYLNEITYYGIVILTNPQINVLPPSSIPSMHLTYLGLLTPSSVTSFTSFDTSFSSLTFRGFHGPKINPFVSFQTLYLSLSLRFATTLRDFHGFKHSLRVIFSNLLSFMFLFPFHPPISVEKLAPTLREYSTPPAPSVPFNQNKIFLKSIPGSDG